MIKEKEKNESHLRIFMDFTFGLQIGPEHEDWFVKLGGVLSSSDNLLDVAWKWCYVSATSTYHTMVPKS